MFNFLKSKWVHVVAVSVLAAATAAAPELGLPAWAGGLLSLLAGGIGAHAGKTS